MAGANAGACFLGSIWPILLTDSFSDISAEPRKQSYRAEQWIIEEIGNL